MKPVLLPAALRHRNFVSARHTTLSLLRASLGGKVVALCGPTQVGKSLIFNHVVQELMGDFRTDDADAMPVVAATLLTSQDGRIAPKHVTLTLLKALRHPTYMYIGELNERDYYRPSRGLDESTMRVALETALRWRSVQYCAFDEAQHLTHTRDPVVRSNVLQSIKCLGAIDRTLFLSGGYELAYRGLFDSAHFAGRLVCVECRPYTDESRDAEEWLSILKAYSERLDLTSGSLLVDECIDLLTASNGCIGLLEKILWHAKTVCGYRGRPIDRAALRDAFPSRQAHEEIHRDIVQGQQALARLTGGTACYGDEEPFVPNAKEARKKRPFKRNPNRRAVETVRVENDE